jgi:hypothetical protein
MVSSLILFFLGFIYSYYFYRDSQKNYEITIFPDSSFNKENIMCFYIWNSGKNTIYKEDLLDKYEGIGVYFDDDYRVEYAKISDQSSHFFNLDLSQNYKNIIIDFDLLRPDEGFTLMVKSWKTSTSHWEFHIKQKKDLINFPKNIKAKGKLSNFHLFSNLFHFSVLSFVIIIPLFWGEIDFKNLDSPLEYFNVIFRFVMLGFLVYMAPVLLGRIRASRPPIELKLHFIEKNQEEQKLSNIIRNMIRFIARKTWRRRK